MIRALTEFDSNGFEEISADSLVSSPVIAARLRDCGPRDQFEGLRFSTRGPKVLSG